MFIEQPRWKVPEYSRKQINDAGDVIRSNSRTPQEQKEALEIIDNWRSAHAYPLHVFYMNLKRKAGARDGVLVAERLKRMNSIIAKLQHEEKMQLYRMQDLGGCRMVLPTVEDVFAFSEEFKKSKIRHEKKNEKNYILNPKPSGYRSLHLVYRFRTETPEKDIYNQHQMLIEIQFRTHLQHIWATALETMGLFTNQALKAGEGREEILRFFVVISSLFAIREKCPVVPGTVEDETELVSEIEQINDRYHVLDMLKAFRVAIDIDEEREADQKGYYVLRLNYESKRLRGSFFKPSELDKAYILYDMLEKEYKDKPYDIVMVRTASYASVRAAYPNYFSDLGEFINLVEGYLR